MKTLNDVYDFDNGAALRKGWIPITDGDLLVRGALIQYKSEIEAIGLNPREVSLILGELGEDPVIPIRVYVTVAEGKPTPDIPIYLIKEQKAPTHKLGEFVKFTEDGETFDMLPGFRGLQEAFSVMIFSAKHRSAIEAVGRDPFSVALFIFDEQKNIYAVFATQRADVNTPVYFISKEL